MPRGEHYIEGIARTFEARNYLVMGCTLIISATDLWLLRECSPWCGLRSPVDRSVAVHGGAQCHGRKRVEHLATIRPGKIIFKGANVFVDDIHFMNLGLDEAKAEFLKKGMGVVLEPKDIDASATLANIGQRQAIAHICAKLLGIYKDVDTPEFTPLVRRDVKTGRLGLLIIPATRDWDALLDAVKRVPVLEGSISRPSRSKAGRKRGDYEHQSQ